MIMAILAAICALAMFGFETYGAVLRDSTYVSNPEGCKTLGGCQHKVSCNSKFMSNVMQTTIYRGIRVYSNTPRVAA